MVLFEVTLGTTLLSLTIISLVTTGEAVLCYQCSSSQELRHEDNCGAYRKFDKSQHQSVECNTDESHMPGSFCMKVTQQGPRGFIWDGRWRQVIRRCASVSDTGVTGVCNWGVYENGDYWEECYCSEDECNSSTAIASSFCFLIVMLLMKVVVF